MLETEEPISKIDCRHFLQEASSCDRVIKRGSGEHAGKHMHMVGVNNCYSFRIQEQFLGVRFCNLPGYFLLNSLRYNLGIS